MNSSSQAVKVLHYTDGELAYYMEHEQSLRENILVALTWLSEGLAEQGWRGVKEPADLVQHVLDEQQLMFVGNTLVSFSIVEPWFMQGQMVAEEFMAPIADPPAPIELVVEALRAVGRAAGCTDLSIGTRANPRQKGLARLLEQTGCRLSTIELIQEIPNG